MRLQQGGKLGRTVEHFFGDARCLEQLGLAFTHTSQVRLQRIGVQLQHGVAEHADSYVDQAFFFHRKARIEFLEQVVGQLHIVDAVAAVVSQLLWGEILPPFTLGIVDLKTLLA